MSARRDGDRPTFRTALLDEDTWPDFAALAEVNPEQTEDRTPQQGSFLHPGPEELYAGLGLVRDRRIAKCRWVMRTSVAPP